MLTLLALARLASEAVEVEVAVHVLHDVVPEEHHLTPRHLLDAGKHEIYNGLKVSKN